jgi:NAD(P)-dependent dehydrogenase (short-subunit alcohol dehydrogenase family)
MNMRLENKVAIVTGGGRGIGRGIARLFAKEGAKVVIAARTEDQLSRVVREIENDGETAASIITDVSVTSDIEKMIQFAIEKYGQLDILVNNAGIGFGYHIDDERVEKAYDNLMATNLRSIWMSIHYAVPEMKKVSGGSIINIASVHAWNTIAYNSAYAASKGGIVAGTRGLAIELAPYMIRANVISPGAIYVGEMEEMIAEKHGEECRKEFIDRFGDIFHARRKLYQPLPVAGLPIDIAYCALYLASDESRFVTGANFTIDGGMTAILSHGTGTDLSSEMKEKEREMREWLDSLKTRRV